MKRMIRAAVRSTEKKLKTRAQAKQLYEGLLANPSLGVCIEEDTSTCIVVSLSPRYDDGTDWCIWQTFDQVSGEDSRQTMRDTDAIARLYQARTVINRTSSYELSQLL